MRYFTIDTIKDAIGRLQEVKGNWLLPAFVFAANHVNTSQFVDMSKDKGTDTFLNLFFDGELVGLPPMKNGNNALRPRLKDVKWSSGPYADDFMIRQDTKIWANGLSSRGYRDMKQLGYIEGERTTVKLTSQFQAQFEDNIADDFRFEDFLVWLYAFRGIPDEIAGWADLFTHFLSSIDLTEFAPPYRGRFRLTDPPIQWPPTLGDRPKNDAYLEALAPKLFAELSAPHENSADMGRGDFSSLPEDDELLSIVASAIQAKNSYAFLLAGPPGTGKTHYARRIAMSLVDEDRERTLFLQFHPAIGYDDFIEGFRPVSTSEGAGIRYELDSRTLLKFAKQATERPDKPFVVVIDELNRGDVARVFGEVLTYIEPGYRGVEFTLPYSGRSVALPENLIFIATANPYDRSVTDLDDALLRRFLVIELEPNAVVLRNYLEHAGVEAGVINRSVQMFNVMNSALPHGFGHAVFLTVRSVEDLAQLWSGRARMQLRRAFTHDKASFDRHSSSIEDLLRIRSGAEGVDADTDAFGAPAGAA